MPCSAFMVTVVCQSSTCSAGGHLRCPARGARCWVTVTAAWVNLCCGSSVGAFAPLIRHRRWRRHESVASSGIHMSRRCFLICCGWDMSACAQAAALLAVAINQHPHSPGLLLALAALQTLLGDGGQATATFHEVSPRSVQLDSLSHHITPALAEMPSPKQKALLRMVRSPASACAVR